MDTSLYLLFRAIREQSTVALSGESADEVFGGYRWFHDPSPGRADTFPWLAALAAGRGRADRVRPWDLDQLDLAGYFATVTPRRWPRSPACQARSGHERRMREICYLHLTRFVRILLDRKDRMSMAVGLEVRVPFCDHRLVEYVYNTPWSMKTFDGREKSLLRAATSDLLPESVGAAGQEPLPEHPGPALHRRAAPRAEAAARRTRTPVLPLVNAAAARAAADGRGEGVRSSAELVLGLDAWLRAYDVELHL